MAGIFKVEKFNMQGRAMVQCKLVKTNCTASFQTKKNGIFLHTFIFGINIYTLDILCLINRYGMQESTQDFVHNSQFLV